MQQNDKRRKLVDLIFDLGRKLRQSNDTCYIAVNYLDSVMHEFEVLEPNFTLFAVCCLLLSCKYLSFYLIAKYDELDMLIPMINDLIRASRLHLSYECVKKCEVIILRMLNWNLF